MLYLPLDNGKFTVYDFAVSKTLVSLNYKTNYYFFYPVYPVYPVK